VFLFVWSGCVEDTKKLDVAPKQIPLLPTFEIESSGYRVYVLSPESDPVSSSTVAMLRVLDLNVILNEIL